MPNAPEPDRGRTDERPGEEGTEGYPLIPRDAETETVVISTENAPDAATSDDKPERRFTAPGFDSKETQVIATSADPATEVIHTTPPPPASGPPQPPPAPPPPPLPPAALPPKAAVPQEIPGRGGRSAGAKQHNWGWVLAIVVIVLALAAIAILGTVLLTRSKHAKVSQEDQVKHTIQAFDAAVQNGDLTALRTITCGTTRDGYVDYDEHSWMETYHRVSAAKQYPVIASIDQVVVNGQHAEANVTTFMAYDPQVRSTRSLDLQFRDDQWKICQSPSN